MAQADSNAWCACPHFIRANFCISCILKKQIICIIITIFLSPNESLSGFELGFLKSQMLCQHGINRIGRKSEGKREEGTQFMAASRRGWRGLPSRVLFQTQNTYTSITSDWNQHQEGTPRNILGKIHLFQAGPETSHHFHRFSFFTSCKSCPSKCR